MCVGGGGGGGGGGGAWWTPLAHGLEDLRTSCIAHALRMDHSVTHEELYAMGLLPETQNCGLHMRREFRERFPPPSRVSDPGLHHGTCVAHVPWCISGSLTNGLLWSLVVGKTFPAFPAHAQPVYLVRGLFCPVRTRSLIHVSSISHTWGRDMGCLSEVQSRIYLQ